jgi:hypothetical protein
MAGAAGTAGGVGATGAAGASSLHAAHSAASSASAQQLNQLMKLLKDFSSADILLALMMMRASESKDKVHHGGDGGALIGLLAGMAYSGQISPSGTHHHHGSVPHVGNGASTGGVGMHVNAHG